MAFLEILHSNSFAGIGIVGAVLYRYVVEDLSREFDIVVRELANLSIVDAEDFSLF